MLRIIQIENIANIFSYQMLIIKDIRRYEEEGGIKEEEEEEEEEMDEVAVDQSAMTDTQSHADLIERRIKRKHATSER